MPTIVLTGGGSAGHVTPNLALVPELKRRGYDIHYIGSYDGIEKSLAENAGLPYTGISTGKLRRYFSLKNLTDPGRVLKPAHSEKSSRPPSFQRAASWARPSSGPRTAWASPA